MWRVCSKGVDSLMVDEFLYCYKPYQIAVSPGFWTLNSRKKRLKLVIGLPTSNREWKDDYIFVCGDNWEGLPWEEKDDSFVRVRRAWGTPPASGVCMCFSLSSGRTVFLSSFIYSIVLTDVLYFLQLSNVLNWTKKGWTGCLGCCIIGTTTIPILSSPSCLPYIHSIWNRTRQSCHCK